MNSEKHANNFRNRANSFIYHANYEDNRANSLENHAIRNAYRNRNVKLA